MGIHTFQESSMGKLRGIQVRQVPLPVVCLGRRSSLNETKKQPHLVPFVTLEPPSSATAIQYLARFCTHHHLYAQSSAALSAALFIREPPSQKDERPILPIPRAARNSDRSPVAQSTKPISAMMSENEALLPYYMTLSSSMLTTLAGMKNILFNLGSNAI